VKFLSPELLKKFEQVRNETSLLVVGDCILDRYFFGEVNRISPEAPVPVFELRKIIYRLGGAANVAANLMGIGVNTYLMGIVGADEKGEVLKTMAQKLGINAEGIVSDSTRPTIIKTRVIAQSQQLLRIDREEKKKPEKELQIKLQEVYEDLLNEVSGVIISDYAKGMFLSDSFCSWVIHEAKRRGKLVFVDPKSDLWKKYEGATTITPNLKEFKAVISRENLKPDLVDAASYLVKKYGLEFLVITKGKEGIMAYHPEKGKVELPAYAKEVYDVSGAGDTVIACFSAFYTAGMGLEHSLEFANVAAGIVVGKVGTQPVYWEEIKSFVDENYKKEVCHG